MGRFLSPRELAQLLAVRVPFAGAPLPISDRAADPGLFGPESVTWRMLREPLLIFAGGRALLMQAAHPLVAQGAIDHSAYSTDPFGRLMRTFDWTGAVAFGTRREARAASALVNRVHSRVTGLLPQQSRTSRVEAGSRYSALDPELLRWVHATFVDTLVVAHDRLVGGLCEDDRNQFVREWDVVGRLMGVPRRLLWKDHAGLRAYVDRQIDDGAVLPGDGSRLVARTIMHPPLPTPLVRPAWDALMFATVGFLPAPLRSGYRIPWTPAHTALHESLCLTLRTTRMTMPRRLRVAPIYDFAMARAGGELAAGRPRRAA